MSSRVGGRRGSQLTTRSQLGSRCWVSVESDNGVSGCVQLGLCSNVKHPTRLALPRLRPNTTGPAELTGVLQRGLQVAATEDARDASLFHLGLGVRG